MDQECFIIEKQWILYKKYIDINMGKELWNLVKITLGGVISGVVTALIVDKIKTVKKN